MPNSNTNKNFVSYQMPSKKRGRPFGGKNPNGGRKKKQPVRESGQKTLSFAPEQSTSSAIPLNEQELEFEDAEALPEADNNEQES
jgi:hypothetical protein